jgi:hypothetical protein
MMDKCEKTVYFTMTRIKYSFYRVNIVSAGSLWRQVRWGMGRIQWGLGRHLAQAAGGGVRTPMDFVLERAALEA